MLNNQLSSSQINETLLNAMKMIAQKEVQNLEFDVTEKYTILEKTKDKNGETCYIVNANNIKREVYPMNNEQYYPDDVVLVQIPKNNILEKKYILGLANSTIERCFLPNSNFIPFLTRDPKNISTNSETLSSISKLKDRELFTNCNSIYLKCDFKIKKYLNYEYGLIVKTIYVNGRETNYYLKSDSFVGINPEAPYYFTQDILFDDIKDFKNIRRIDVKFYAPEEFINQAKNEVMLRNLEISIGKSIVDNNTGLEIVTFPNNKDYNDTKNDFSRQLGLIWYNRDLEGDFVGFNSQNVVNEEGILETIQTEVINGNYETIMTDEYEYINKKNDFDKLLSLYNTGTCPYDLDGLNLIQKINSAELTLKNVITGFSKNSEYIYSAEQDFEELWIDLLKLISPENLIKDEEQQETSNLPKYFAVVSGEKKNLNLIIEKLINRQSNAFIELNEMCNIWITFAANIFYNVHKMQGLEENLDLEQLEIKEPIDKNNETINFIDIIDKIKQTKNSTRTEINPNLYEKIKYFLDNILKPYWDIYKDFYKNEADEEKFNNWIEKIENLISQIDDLFLELNTNIYNIYTDLISNNSLKYENYNDFLYNTNLSVYYDLYYNKYKKYRDDLISGLQFEDNYSIIEKKLEFDPVFPLDKTTKNKFALYWYEEDLNNLQIDPLLNENCWTLIDNKDYLTFPPLEEVNRKYYFKKAAPYDRMLLIRLPDNVKTKAYKVVLYYNHELQGSAEITFNNKSYIDIGFQNSLIDLEYGRTDIRTLSTVTTNTFSKLPISIICYKDEKSREALTDIAITRKNSIPTTFPTLQATPLLFKSEKTYNIKEITNKNNLNTLGLGREGEINFAFEHESKEKFVPFGVYRFKLWLDSENTVSAYHPFAWSLDCPDLVLHGAKMVSISNDGKCTYDSWQGNESNPLPYTLTGVENINNLNYKICYYTNSGDYKLEENLSTGNAFSIIKNNDAYQLSFDIEQAKECLKLYRPVLVINGYYGETNKKFTFYQSLFIEHGKYDYDTNEFLDDDKNSESVEEFIIRDSKESILVQDLKKQIEMGYSFLGPSTSIIKPQAAIKELNRILNNSKVSNGYEYYFKNLARLAPNDKNIFINILNKLNNSSTAWKETQTHTAIPLGGNKIVSQTLTIENWIHLLFLDLNNLAQDYDNNPDFYYSAISLSYEDIKQFLENNNKDNQDGEK